MTDKQILAAVINEITKAQSDIADLYVMTDSTCGLLNGLALAKALVYKVQATMEE